MARLNYTEGLYKVTHFTHSFWGQMLRVDFIMHFAITIFIVLHFTYRQQVWLIPNQREWGTVSKHHRAIKDISQRVGQQLRGGSAASMGPGGLVSNQSGFDVYWQHMGLSWETCISFVFNEAVRLAWPPLPSPSLGQTTFWDLLTAAHQQQLQVGVSERAGKGFGNGIKITGITMITILITITRYARIWFTWRHSWMWN